jgi:hypothetical protein
LINFGIIYSQPITAVFYPGCGPREDDASAEIALALPKFTMIAPHNKCLPALVEVQITSPEDKTLIYGVLLLLS